MATTSAFAADETARPVLANSDFGGTRPRSVKHRMPAGAPAVQTWRLAIVGARRRMRRRISGNGRILTPGPHSQRMKAIVTSIIVLAWASAASAQDGGAAASLALADTNGDGAVTRAEFDAMRAAGFDRLDVNHDGHLTSEESQNAGRRRAQITSADANGDGRVSRAEFLAQPPRGFNRFDANRNDLLEASELEALQSALQRFGG